MNDRNQDKTVNDYEPLACIRCGKDILETGLGNFVWVKNRHNTASPRFVDAYWVCKAPCDELVGAQVDIEKYSTPWTGINHLMNPLEFRRWDRATSRLINQGAVSASAATKVKELKRIVVQAADREPTDEDIAEYRRFRWMDGL